MENLQLSELLCWDHGSQMSWPPGACAGTYRGTHWPATTAASPQNKQVNPAPISSQIRAWSQSSREEDALLWCSHLTEDTPATAGHQRSLPADCPLHLPAWLNSRAYRSHTQEQASDVHICQASPDGEKALCRGFTSEGINLFWLGTSLWISVTPKTLEERSGNSQLAWCSVPI